MNKAERTRLAILDQAFSLIYRNGYQATSIDNIIKPMSVTKGAFFYHFKNKEEMGLAVINEIIFPRVRKGLIQPMNNQEEPIKAIYAAIAQFMMGISEQELLQGCPMNNLIQEMAPINERFQQALSRILISWKKQIIQNLTFAHQIGQIQHQDFAATAQFIIASYEGARGVGKLYRSYDYYKAYLNQLENYLKSF